MAENDTKTPVRVLTDVELRDINIATLRRENATLRLRLLERQAQDEFVQAFRAVGLNPAKTYEINPETREVFEK